MLPAYADIRSRIPEPPIWFDANGVPRYESFHPKMLGVYDQFALLVEIACQSCGQRFLVGQGWTEWNFRAPSPHRRDLTHLAQGFQFGDPPRHDIPAGRCAGETMTSTEVRVVEAWEQVGSDWRRRPDLEIPYAAGGSSSITA